MNKSITTLVAAATILLAGCSSSPKWKVDGHATESAKGEKAYLQTAVNGQWTTIDSVAISDDLTYTFTGAAPKYPDIYRISIGDASVYFPIDSIDDITIDAAGRIAGSSSADMMQRINDLIANAPAPTPGSGFDEATKREIAKVMAEDLGGIAAYYAINKSIGNTPLWNPANKFDKRIIGGVATQFMTRRPTDPRTALLQNAALTSLRLYSDNPGRVEAREIPFIEINLRDSKGSQQSLTELWSKNRVTILNFTLLTPAESAAYNKALNDVLEKYSGRGVAIYQVGCDDDEFAWEKAAANLPWTAVYSSPLHDAQTLVSYNIASLPTTFVISHDGERMERVDDIAKLDATVARML